MLGLLRGQLLAFGCHLAHRTEVLRFHSVNKARGINSIARSLKEGVLLTVHVITCFVGKRGGGVSKAIISQDGASVAVITRRTRSSSHEELSIFSITGILESMHLPATTTTELPRNSKDHPLCSVPSKLGSERESRRSKDTVAMRCNKQSTNAA